MQLLGLAARAGQVAKGTQQVQDAVRAGRVHFALVASDLTATGSDKLIPLLEARRVPYAAVYTRDELGAAVGRSALAAVGVMASGFADRLALLVGSAGPN